ncbi:MAG: glycosyltransferase [Bacilli bacterium]|nr:glycosyltransferase [Bacilli bacterium]
MKVKVSVIVPVYNVEEYLPRCLDTLVGSTLKDIEIILINDGSPDNSEEIIKKYQKKFKDIIVYHKKVNEGQGVARNYALNIAKGEYVTFVDSDDFIDIRMLEKLYNKGVKDKADIVCSTGHIEVTSDTRKEIKYEFDSKDSHIKYILNNSGPWGKIVKKDLILKNNLTFPNLRAYEDISVVPLWSLYAKKISYVDEPLYYYLIREGSTMKQTKYNDKLTHIYPSLDNLYNNFIDKTKDKYTEEVEYIYIEHLLHAASLRFMQFDKYEEVEKITKIIKEKFPKWNKNKYYQNKSIKYKIVCTLIYHKQFKLLKLILK